MALGISIATINLSSAMDASKMSIGAELSIAAYPVHA
jgi:hypothetical protein